MEEELDLITGLPHTGGDDEYIRQAAERLLLDLGYERSQVAVDYTHERSLGERCLCIRADLAIRLEGRVVLVITCRRGSLVSREKETVAAARLIAEPWAPFALVFNKDSAELLDTKTGRVIGEGLEAVPGPVDLADMARQKPPEHPDKAALEQAARVYEAYSFIQCPGKCTV
jgi:hypothetical protein